MNMHLRLLLSCAALAASASPRLLALEAGAKFTPLDLTPAYRPTFTIKDKAVYNGFQKVDERKNSSIDPASRPTGPNLTLVMSRFGELGLSGVIPSTLGPGGLIDHKGVIILGGQVYREGDELVTYDAKSHRTLPIVTDHKVVLHSITLQAIGLDVALIGLRQSEQLRIELDEFLQR